ncbi:MAG: four helix bundle protein [Crocinitomicaceae bacterium]|nr:four helix bundle protein [Crocinitomicaceae bacterium]
MKENVIKRKSFEFAVLVVEMNKKLNGEMREFVLSKQFLRSGTAVGALIREAEQAESKKDFIHKLAISLKEANETEYWIELMHETKLIQVDDFEDLFSRVKELIRMLISIINTTKRNIAHSN